MPVEKSNTYTIIFAAILCLVSSTALTLVSKGLEPRKNFNLEIDKKKNVLKSFGIETKGIKNNLIADLFDKNISESSITTENNNSLSLYRAINKNYAGYAIPISGYGLWGMMYGYLALENDLNTIKGITFYKHQETPGLGGEIEAEWFQKNFIGKKICDTNGKLKSIKVVKGAVADVIPEKSEQQFCVDGISGATMTSDGITVLLLDELTRYEPHFKKLRKGTM